VWRVGVMHVPDSAALVSEAHAVGGASDSWALPVQEPTEWLEADAVVLATGGLSFPRTGSDGTGYALARALGHSIVPPAPALTPLVAVDPMCGGAQGVTLEATLTLYVDGKRDAEASGSLLFTHFGLSGPAALDLSRHWHQADGKGRRVTLSFAPEVAGDAVEADWLDFATRFPRRGLRAWLGEALPDRIADILTAESGLGGAALSQIPREGRVRMLAALLARDMGVTGTLGYEKAEVTAGGVTLSEVNSSTLESRLAPGLWLCGEMLDVEGRLGGFNFQWAWSSGTVAGRAAATH
jgi:predicted Rossmann fold flavoprotein